MTDGTYHKVLPINNDNRHDYTTGKCEAETTLVKNASEFFTEVGFPIPLSHLLFVCTERPHVSPPTRSSLNCCSLSLLVLYNTRWRSISGLGLGFKNGACWSCCRTETPRESKENHTHTHWQCKEPRKTGTMQAASVDGKLRYLEVNLRLCGSPDVVHCLVGLTT